jgi:putative membrane protein
MKNRLTNQPENIGFFQTALKIQGSATPKVIKIVLFFMLYAIFISILGHLYRNIALPIGPFEYGGLIMGLIVVFRINSGYDRWWEARKLWGNIVNQSRNFVIVLLNYTKTNDKPWVINTCQMMAALPFLIKTQLRGQKPRKDKLDKLLSDDIYTVICNDKNPANILSSIIAQELQTARDIHGMDGFAFLKADDQREQILNAQGACERILNTPMPLVMAIKSRRFILLFLLVLPFALINVSVFLTPWVMFLVAYALLSLDQISIELQNPFSEENLSHLPLDTICQTIKSNILELIDQKKLT